MNTKILFLILAIQMFAIQVRGDTVVAVHGFLTDWRSMRSIEHVFKNSNYPVLLWGYPSRKKFIEEHACDLVATLQEIARCCPGAPIHFVTHSIGALILRAALNIPCCPEEAKNGKAVLLAPPNQGSTLANRFKNIVPIKWIMGEKSGWQLSHYSAYDVAGLGEFPSSMNVLVIAGTLGNKFLFREPNDGYLRVEETALNTPYCRLCFPVEHGSGMIKNPYVLRCMKQFIVNSGQNVKF